MSNAQFIERLIIAFTLGLLIGTVFFFSKAHAHDHEHPGLNDWFLNLKSGKGPCCDGDEAVHLRDIEWETQEKEHSHYRVKIPVTGEAYAWLRKNPDGKVNTMWIDVPDDAVITEPNIAGVALVWPVYGYLGADIRCFLPGQMS
jgi:hypothetical protein